MSDAIKQQIVNTKRRLLDLGYFDSAEDMTHIVSHATERRDIIAEFKHVPTALEIVQACKGHELADIKVEGWPSGKLYLMKYVPMTAEEIQAKDRDKREMSFKIWKFQYRSINGTLNRLQKELEEQQ
jgi:hypothetical protein